MLWIRSYWLWVRVITLVEALHFRVCLQGYSGLATKNISFIFA